MKLILPFGVGLFSLMFSGTTGAQTLQVPRVEVGVQAGFLGAIAECFCVLPAFGPRLTFNITPQSAIELSAETLTPAGPGTYGLFFLQYKGATRPSFNRSGIRPFYTAGTGGYFAYNKVPERRQARQDGSVVVYPAHSTGELSRLNIVSFGGGFERVLSRYASFRLEGNGFAILDSDDGFLAYRVLAGVSIPIGGYRATTIQ